jgi:tetratricopeptide (TPR) repeat protein
MSTTVNAINVYRFLMKVFLIPLVCMVALLPSCKSAPCDFEIEIEAATPPYLIETLPSPFQRLTAEEKGHDWARELYVGRAFARQNDYYRAITCFKSALILIPKANAERRLEIEYEIVLAYYLGGKYQEAIDTYEIGGLKYLSAASPFPALKELYIILYDAYMRLDKQENGDLINSRLKEISEEAAEKSVLSSAIIKGDFATLCEFRETNDVAADLLSTYSVNARSAPKAKFLNAIMPGAGYLYVGQKKTALTSFVINALFIAASYQLYEKGYYPAAIIMTSLELGWYIGGMNGAAIAANEFNQCLYHKVGRQALMNEKLFPVLMIQKGF